MNNGGNRLGIILLILVLVMMAVVIIDTPECECYKQTDYFEHTYEGETYYSVTKTHGCNDPDCLQRYM